MLKLLLTLGCALLLPMVAGQAAAQSAPATPPWWTTIESPPAQLGLHGFVVDQGIPTVRGCKPDDKFFCVSRFEGERSGVLGSGVAYYQASATDSFLGHTVRLAVVIEENVTRGLAAITGGPKEQERILAELTKRHGAPTDVWRKNVRLVQGGPGYEYMTAHWDLEEGEICFKGTTSPQAGQTQPAETGLLRYWANDLRSLWTCS